MNLRSLLSHSRIFFAGCFALSLAAALPAAWTAPIITEADAWGQSTVANLDNTSVLQSSAAGQQIFVRFRITGITGKIYAVKLRLHPATGNTAGGNTTIYAANNSGGSAQTGLWSETATWANRPYRAPNTVFSNATPAPVGDGFVEFFINNCLSGDGVYTFVLTSTVSKKYDNGEGSAAFTPRLIVDQREATIADATYTPKELLDLGKELARRIHLGGDLGGPAAASYFKQYGAIDVTKQPYGALRNGTDDRLAIQRAINDARLARAVVYFPTGTYTIGDTLEMVQGVIDPDTDIDVDPTDGGYVAATGAGFIPAKYKEKWTNAREFGNALIGPSGSGRAVLKLSDTAPGFNTSTVPKPLLRIWARDSRTSNDNPTGNQLAINYNQTLSNIDIDLNRGPAHQGAVGMELGLAQGGTISDCKITATGGYAALYGSTGPGGGMYNLTLDGGQYGLYVPSGGDGGQQALLTASVITHQDTNAVFWSGLGGLTIVGTNMIETKGIKISCGTTNPWNGMLCLVDSQIKLATAGLAIDTDRSVYMQRVHVFKGSPVLNPHDGETPGTYHLTSATNWINIDDYAGGQHEIDQFPAKKDDPNNPDANKSNVPAFVDGNRHEDVQAHANVMAANPVIPDYLPDHKMPGAPDFFATDNINVMDYGASGNGIADDTQAIQDAIEAGNSTLKPVFLPKGDYRLSKPLQLRYNTVLFGINKNYTFIQSRYPEVLTPAEQATYAYDNTAANAQPLVVANSGINSNCQLANLTLVQRLSEFGAYLLQWQTGRKSVVREVGFLRRPMMGGLLFSEHPAIQIEGTTAGGKFYNLWLVADQVVEGSETGGEWFSGTYRDVLVTGTRERLAFYMMNCEYMHNHSLVEMDDVQNVNVYQSKWEGNYVNFQLTDSPNSNLQVFGLGGNSCPFPFDVADHTTSASPYWYYDLGALNDSGRNQSISIKDSGKFLFAGQAYQQRQPVTNDPLKYESETGTVDSLYNRSVGAATNPTKFYRLKEKIGVSTPKTTPGVEQFVLYQRGSPTAPVFP